MRVSIGLDLCDEPVNAGQRRRARRPSGPSGDACLRIVPKRASMPNLRIEEAGKACSRGDRDRDPPHLQRRGRTSHDDPDVEKLTKPTLLQPSHSFSRPIL